MLIRYGLFAASRKHEPLRAISKRIDSQYTSLMPPKKVIFFGIPTLLHSSTTYAKVKRRREIYS